MSGETQEGMGTGKISHLVTDIRGGSEVNGEFLFCPHCQFDRYSLAFRLYSPLMQIPSI